MGPSAAWFYEGQLRLHRNLNWNPNPPLILPSSNELTWGRVDCHPHRYHRSVYRCRDETARGPEEISQQPTTDVEKLSSPTSFFRFCRLASAASFHNPAQRTTLHAVFIDATFEIGLGKYIEFVSKTGPLRHFGITLKTSLLWMIFVREDR